ncbi:MAG: BON domain-containing protein [Verrucomicrobiota bacterium]
MRNSRRSFWLAAVASLALLAGCATSPYEGMQAAPGAGSDQQLVVEVRNRLDNDGITRQRDFGVQVNGGVVTVYGIVPSETVRGRVVAVIRDTPGVQDVVDRLQLQR